MERHSDYLIVGQGLAGTVMGRLLERKGKSVIIVDEPQPFSASKVAAGLWNPVVVRRFTKSWLADEAVPVMKSFYREEEEQLSAEFFYTRPLLKLFSNEEEQQDFKRQFARHQMQAYVDEEICYDLPEVLRLPFGAMRIREAGYMDVPGYLRAAASHWEKQGTIIREAFDHAALLLSPEGVKYKNTRSSCIIFCEGAGAERNPLLQKLDFRSTKGEILKLHIPALKMNECLSKQVFVMPLGNDLYRVGATYNWNEVDTLPSEHGKQELLDKLAVILDAENTLADHNAGIRPTMTDRRPVLGLLSGESRVAVFNGLGSKGVMLAPLLAGFLAARLIDNNDLIPLEASTQRFGL